jgi:hypothetical protein
LDYQHAIGIHLQAFGFGVHGGFSLPFTAEPQMAHALDIHVPVVASKLPGKSD